MSSSKGADDVEVTRQDQDMINSYGKLNSRMNELKRSRQAIERETETLKDVENELMLAEDDFVMYKIGESFIKISKEEAEERLSNSQKGLDAELDKIGNQMGGIQKQMAELKVVLKGKFKNSINLDPSEE